MATTMTPTNKSSTTTMTGIIRAGQGWKYDETGILYDGPTDAEGREVLYDSIGSATTMTPLSKNTVTMGGQAKT